jgi:hypothetical protein
MDPKTNTAGKQEILAPNLTEAAPRTDQVPHRSRDLLDGHVRVDTVLVEEVDDVGLQALERGLGDLLDVLGAAVQTLLGAVRIEAELGGDHHLIANRSEGFAHQLLVGKRAVDFRGVEEGDTTLHGGSDQRGRLLLVCGRTVTEV